MRHIGRGVARDQVIRDDEGPHSLAASAELVEGGAILVRDQEMAVLGVDDETFRVEGMAQYAGGIWGDAVQGVARCVLEDHGLENLEAAGRAGRPVDLQAEALHPGCVVEGAATGTAIGEALPVPARRVVVDVREVTNAAGVDVRAATTVEHGAVEGEAIDECRRSQRGRGGRGTDQAHRHDHGHAT